MENNEDKGLIKVTGLWKNQEKGYLSGSFGYSARVFIFKNNRKEKPSDPDYNMCIGQKRRKEEEDTVPAPSSMEASEEAPF